MTEHVRSTNRLPETGAGFVWDTFGTTVVLRPAVDGVAAAFTTRVGGGSEPPFDGLNLSFVVGDDDERVRANRELAGGTIGAGGRWSVVRQVHGADVVHASDEIGDADAQWTDEPARTLAVFAADCVPVLVIGPRGRLGVAHAGWRGLVGGVIEATIRAVGGSPRVVAGPAIGPCCYEVGGDVAEPFLQRFGPSVIAGDGRLDLWHAADLAASDAGAASSSAARVCTSCHPELFFSHRRDGGRTGRQALLARVLHD